MKKTEELRIKLFSDGADLPGILEMSWQTLDLRLHHQPDADAQSNPTQRNLRMSLTISLDEVGACLATVSIIVLSRVLVLIAPSYSWRRSLQPPLWPRSQHIIA